MIPPRTALLAALALLNVLALATLVFARRPAREASRPAAERRAKRPGVLRAVGRLASAAVRFPLRPLRGRRRPAASPPPDFAALVAAASQEPDTVESPAPRGGASRGEATLAADLDRWRNRSVLEESARPRNDEKPDAVPSKSSPAVKTRTPSLSDDDLLAAILEMTRGEPGDAVPVSVVHARLRERGIAASRARVARLLRLTGLVTHHVTTGSHGTDAPPASRHDPARDGRVPVPAERTVDPSAGAAAAPAPPTDEDDALRPPPKLGPNAAAISAVMDRLRSSASVKDLGSVTADERRRLLEAAAVRPAPPPRPPEIPSKRSLEVIS